MNILLLHGALGSRSQLLPLSTLLEAKNNVHTLDFSGHGGRQPMPENFSITLFAQNVIDYMNTCGITTTSIFGYSMGGYIALYLAKHDPDRIEKIITLATKFDWNEAIAERETKMLDPEKTKLKVPDFASDLQNKHAPNDWKDVMRKTAEMMRCMGKSNPLKTEDYTSIHQPVLLLIGDNDKMVTRNETEYICNLLPDAKMRVLHDTKHPIESVDLVHLQQIIAAFIG